MTEASELRDKYFGKLIEINNDTSKLSKYLDLFNKNDNNLQDIENYSKKLSLIENLEWINVNKGLSINDLKGKIVLFDFWTYCCINCFHVIPLLKQLELKFENLVVIGVHSAKFTNEKSKKNILNAVKRHSIKHPVVCDNNLDLWSNLEISCWPSFLVLNPNGHVIGDFKGELEANLIEKFIETCFDYYKNELVLNKIEKLSIKEKERTPESSGSNTLSELCFPSKLCLDQKNSILYVSDSGNNRILAIDSKNSNLLFTIGESGLIGYQDGSFMEAKFNWQQGIILDNDEQIIYVADTGNDLIRSIDLKTRMVNTLCGKYNGINKIGDYDYIGGKQALQQTISSPWDLTICKKLIDNKTYKFLLIACAGTHQIWLYTFKIDVDNIQSISWWRNVNVSFDTLICIAGNGNEKNRNNSYPLNASFAQPSGLAIDKSYENLYIADAESSTIRVLSLKDGSVKNVVGGDSSQPDNLFAYGDIDAIGTKTRLQHPMDVKILNDENELIIADAYNNKLKIVNLKTKSCKSFTGNSLSEPNGLCVDENNEIIFVADTNDHSIKIIKNYKTNQVFENFFVNFSKKLNDDVRVEINEKKTDDLYIKLEDKMHLNRLASNTWELVLTTTDDKTQELNGAFKDDESDQNLLKITSIDLTNLQKLNLKLSLVHCIDTGDSQVCKIFRKKFEFNKEELIQLHLSNKPRVLVEIKI